MLWYAFNSRITMKKDITIVCSKCLKPSKKGVISCTCSTSRYYDYETVLYDYKKAAENFPLVGTHNGLDRFLPLLPNEKFSITLGEGNTPLLHFQKFGLKYGLARLFVKNETGNPTGCFKDRETAVGINVESEQGTKKIEIVSSGNAAISAVAYSNKAGIECLCHIPETTSEGKKQLLQIFGAKFQLHKGDYENIYRNVIDSHSLKDTVVNFTAGKYVYREEGNKTIAFEIYEQLDAVPDTVVVPIGNGSLLFAVYKGFWELLQMKKIKKIPKMIGVQIAGFSPVAEALRQGKDFVALPNSPHSIAEGGIAAMESYCSPKAIKAIKETDGAVIEITDADLVRVLKELITEESFVVEPTSLAPFAAFSQIKSEPNETIVCVATGNAFKNLEEILRMLEGWSHAKK
ncbi:MAG: pyridoxal-phosphate dependent enzyme [Patescibacteria group bacterium]